MKTSLALVFSSPAARPSDSFSPALHCELQAECQGEKGGERQRCPQGARRLAIFIQAYDGGTGKKYLI